MVDEPRERGHRGADAHVVGDRAGVVERDVEVGAHEHVPAVDVTEVFEDGQRVRRAVVGHYLLAAPMINARSTNRFE